MLLSTVRTNSGRFISDYRRINVALTRAQHGMIVFGHRPTLKQDAMWRYMLEYHADQVCNDVKSAIELTTYP